MDLLGSYSDMVVHPFLSFDNFALPSSNSFESVDSMPREVVIDLEQNMLNKETLSMTSGIM